MIQPSKEMLAPNKEVNGTLLHQRYNEKITNKEVTLEAKDVVGSFMGCYFKDCVIRIKCSAQYTIHMTNECRFDNCLIWAHTKQSGGNWKAWFTDCSFKGWYELRFENEIISCDFSEAKVEYVHFLENTDRNNLKGLYYPVVTIKEINKHYEEWEKAPKPRDYTDLVWTSKRNGGLIAMDLNAVTKEPHTLWQAVEPLDFVSTQYKSQD
ncbi:hypothetical protein AB9P05_23790 [Roseivirga sp. BDSF3-8]|uniref:hypothetical protein n=1 Tax=Roseivirga sp. BDSF3-8 TaxID=3241598 RepID=UPI0035319257